MSKHNNNGGRQFNGIGSADQRNNGNGRNGSQGSMSDGKRFITESRDTKSFRMYRISSDQKQRELMQLLRIVLETKLQTSKQKYQSCL